MSAEVIQLPVEPWIGLDEIARHMGVSVRTINRWCAEDAPHETWGLRTKKFRASELEAWARQRGERAS